MPNTAQLTFAPAAANPSTRIVFVFSYLTISLLFLQKIGLNFAGGVIGVGTIVLWVGLMHLAVIGVLKVQLGRLALFVAFLCAAVGGLLAMGDVAKPQALVIIVMLYASLIFVVEIDEATKLGCLLFYQKCMIAISCIVLAQQVIQYTIGSAYWPNFERVVPQSLLIEGYAYFRPYHWRSQYLTPNGVFFLEPSALSACMSIALIVEMIFFKNLARLTLYMVALVAGLAVSGIAMVMIASPFLLFNLNKRLLAGLAVLGVPILVAILASGLLANLAARTGELSDKQSSGYARIMLPLNTLTNLATNPNFTYFGAGPGQSSRRKDEVQWPFSKLLYEYGLLSALIFHVFLLAATLICPPSLTLALAILIPHLCFGGGFVSHVNVVIIFLFCSVLREQPEALAHRRITAT